MDDWTAGDYGGVLAGVVAALIGLARLAGSAIDWFAGRIDKRAAKVEREEAQLLEWRESLNRREKEYRAELEARINAFEQRVQSGDRKIAVLAASLIDVTTELRLHVPASPALTRSNAALRVAFPMEHDLEGLLARLDAQDGDEHG